MLVMPRGYNPVRITPNMKASQVMPIRKSGNSYLVPVILIVVASALAYLPHLLQATVYRDDWYYVLDRMIGGPGVFQAMFSIDRPARGPFFELYYLLFGVNPLPYHLVSFLWRVLGGLSALWLFRLLWPRQPRATMWMALLFVLFPGYLRWMEGIEDQPRIASLCLEALSFALTLKAIRADRPLPKIAALVGSILSGWAYLALLDFGIGMEVLRFLCVFIFVDRPALNVDRWKRLLAALRAWAFAAVIPVGFLFWRLFIFHNERPQTDVGKQLGVLLASPLSTAALWLVRTVQSAASVLVFSWITPALQGFFNLRLKEMLIGGALALLAVGAVYLAAYLSKRADPDPSPADGGGGDWTRQALWIGLIGVVAGLLPVIAANRFVNFDSYSHYALPASLAGAMFITGLAFSFKPGLLSVHTVAFLVASALLAHFSYASTVVSEEQAASAFWHQVAWRVPALKQQTTIYVNYPGFSFGDNIDAADGPANFIYFPQQTRQIPATYPVMALSQQSQTTNDVLLGRDQPTGYRTHVGILDFQRLLVLTQPSPTSCVHVLNGASPLFSSADPDQVRVIGSYSRIQNVVPGPHQPALAAFMFGPEPPHRWCYFFEKADLALQQADWQQVSQLGKDAAAADLHPEDWVEWIPFLQAYAHLGDEALFTATAHRLNGDAFARLEACNTLVNMQSSGDSFTPQVRAQMDTLLCRGE